MYVSGSLYMKSQYNNISLTVLLGLILGLKYMALLSAQLLLVSFFPLSFKFLGLQLPLFQQILPVLPSEYMQNLCTSLCFHCYHARPNHCQLLPRPLQQLPNSFLSFCFHTLYKPSRYTSRENILKCTLNHATPLPKAPQ